LSLKSHGYGFGVSLLFFGCFCLIVGYLIFRSGYLPKVVGVLMQIAGVCYLTIGEASLCLWLLLKGVNMEKWEERASARRASGA
jgi:Domain of unknown function (DUF4386)